MPMLLKCNAREKLELLTSVISDIALATITGLRHQSKLSIYVCIIYFVIFNLNSYHKWPSTELSIPVSLWPSWWLEEVYHRFCNFQVHGSLWASAHWLEAHSTCSRWGRCCCCCCFWGRWGCCQWCHCRGCWRAPGKIGLWGGCISTCCCGECCGGLRNIVLCGGRV